MPAAAAKKFVLVEFVFQMASAQLPDACELVVVKLAARPTPARTMAAMTQPRKRGVGIWRINVSNRIFAGGSIHTPPGTENQLKSPQNGRIFGELLQNAHEEPSLAVSHSWGYEQPPQFCPFARYPARRFAADGSPSPLHKDSDEGSLIGFWSLESFLHPGAT